MPSSYVQLLGHVVTAVHAIGESGDLAAALAKGGFAKSRAAEGKKLAHEAEDLIREKIDAIGEDRTREHAVHAATQEVEMWMQTVNFAVKKAVEEESVVELVRAKSLHAHDHSVTVVALAARMMAMLRCDERVYERLGGADATREMLNRGLALTKKLYRACDIRLAPEGDEADLAIFSELANMQARLEAFLLELADAARTAADKDVRLVGRLGLVPDGVGIPAGGTSFAVVLHERGQTDAPDPTNVTDCPGWSVGRQGRNRENLGKGWVDA